MQIHQEHETGPFDIFGDIHGCMDELLILLRKLGYQVLEDEEDGFYVDHPEGRRVVFAGDLVDRGPQSVGVLRFAMAMVSRGLAFSVMGNHDDRLRRWLRGNKVHIAHGLETTIAEFRQESGEFRARVEDFLSGFPSHLILDGGQLIVAHAGMRREFIGDPHPRVMRYCMYGETTGEVDQYGRPIRLPWAQDYTGKAFVAYGHNPVESPSWTDRTVNLDTGCVFGGHLSVLRWPKKEIVQVKALKTYCPRVGWKETF